MIFRLLFLLTLCLGLATGPVCNVGNCITPTVAMKCAHCCPEKSAGCCAKGGAPAEKMPQLATASLELKQALVPMPGRIGAQPALVIPPTRAHSRAFSYMPVRPRLDVTCIRLI